MASNSGFSRRSFIVSAAGLSAGAVLSSCATIPAQPAKAPDDTSNYFFDTMARRNQTVSSVYYDRELSDWLPNHVFEIEGDAPRPFGAGLATGTISDVVGGRGYVVGKSEEAGETVAFDSPEALWRTVDVTMSVTDAWGDVAGEEVVKFGVAFGSSSDSKLIISSLRKLDTVVATFLKPGFFHYDPSLYSIGRSGMLLGTVDSTSGLHFPSLAALGNEDVERNFLSKTLTSQDLTSQAEGERVIIRVKGGERLQ